MGEVLLDFVIKRLDTLDEIYERSFPVRFANPLQEIRCLLRVRNCVFPVAGHYQFMLLADNELVAQRNIRITLK
jgi:hypothetical protein